MAIGTVKRVAGRMLKAGSSRIRILDAKKAKEALTHEDIAGLIAEGVVKARKKKGVGRGKAKIKQARKHAGRRRGAGSMKGSKYAKTTRKELWMRKIRSQRKYLQKTRDQLEDGAYRQVYRRIKGNNFRDKKQLVEHLKTRLKKK